MDKEAAQPWYQVFFTQRYMDARADMFTSEQTVREVDFLIDKLGLTAGQKVLDLCCGQGRHSVELARRGFQVTGLDLSEYLLDLARQAQGAADVEVRWIHADARAVPFENEFVAVINMFTAFGYLENDEEDRKVLSAAANALQPGGRLLIDVMNRERSIRFHRPNHWSGRPDGTLVLSENTLDLTAGVVQTSETVVHPDGQRATSSFRLRLYTLAELVRMCRSVGLEFSAVFGDFSGGPYGIDSMRLILIAVKS